MKIAKILALATLTALPLVSTARAQNQIAAPEAPLAAPLADNIAPQGFTALFNGRDLEGWRGLVADPPARAKMAPEELEQARRKATEEALKHWTVVDGAIAYDGKNNNLCTGRDYGDFELLLDWKIEPGGDSGLYLRGSPQIQIWDDAIGSGAMYNNQKNPSQPPALQPSRRTPK